MTNASNRTGALTVGNGLLPCGHSLMQLDLISWTCCICGTALPGPRPRRTKYSQKKSTLSQQALDGAVVPHALSRKPRCLELAREIRAVMDVRNGELTEAQLNNVVAMAGELADDLLHDGEDQYHPREFA